MVVLCRQCESVICDFCWYYCCNGPMEYRRDSWQQIDTEEGFCWLTMLPTDFADGCDDFHCRWEMEEKYACKKSF